MKADLYVSPAGNDSWSGKRPDPNATGTDGPLATLAAARDAVRLMEKGRPVTVELRGGNHPMERTCVFGPEDSGTAEAPVSYRAAAGEKPVLVGGRRITGWEVGSDGVWTVRIPEVERGEWYFRSLWVNGERRSRPCLPKEGAYEVAAPAEPKHEAFRYNPGEIDPGWRSRDDVEIVVVQFWTEARLRIREIDTETNTVTFTGASWRPLSWSKAWFAENVSEAFELQGEWYLDRPTGTLSYRPLPGEDPESVEIIAPVAETLIRVQGDAERPVEHLVFSGIGMGYTYWEMPEPHGISIPQAEIPRKEGVVFAGDLAYGRDLPQVAAPVPATFSASGMRHCAVEGCEISRTGGWAVELLDRCADNRIAGNHIHDIGAGAVRIGEPGCPERDEDETVRTMVTDNVIHDGSRVFLGPAGIWVGHSSGNLIAHNEIYNDFEWGISVGWSWNYFPPGRHQYNVVEYNHVHHLGMSHTGCHGAIYFLGVSPGTVCRRNVIDHITGGCGIILDNACFGILIEDNLSYHTGAAGLCFNYNDSGNIVRNNIFALSKTYMYERYGDLPATGGEKVDQTGIFYRNIFYWKEGRFMRRDEWPNFDTLMNHNLYWDGRDGSVDFAGLTFDGWRGKGLDRDSVLADPLFTDPENGDFTLPPDSPALRLGFRPFDPGEARPRRGGRGE